MLKKLEDKLASIVIIYFLFGLVFAISYALFYKWSLLSFLSPQFYIVVVSWPFQIPGFINDFRLYGFAGKTLL